MQRVIAAFVGAALAVGLAGTVPAAGSVPVGEKKPKFCRTLEKLSEDIGPAPTDGTQIDIKQAAKVAKALRKAAKVAPKSLRKPLKTLAAVYERVADGATLVDIIEDEGVEFSEASARYALYYAEKCLGVDVPDTEPPA